MKSLLLRFTAAAADHDWQTRLIEWLPDGTFEETQHCPHCGLRRTVNGADADFPALTMLASTGRSG